MKLHRQRLTFEVLREHVLAAANQGRKAYYVVSSDSRWTIIYAKAYSVSSEGLLRFHAGVTEPPGKVTRESIATFSDWTQVFRIDEMADYLNHITGNSIGEGLDEKETGAEGHGPD